MKKVFNRVLICEDQYVTQVGLESLIKKYLPNPVQIMSAPTGEDALNLFAQEPPDLVLMDLSLPGIPGTEVIRHIRDSNDSCVIIVLTANNDPDQLRSVLKLKVNAVLRKLHTGKNLNKALIHLQQSQNKIFLDESVEYLTNKSPDRTLSVEEYDVLNFLVQGYPLEDIATKLNRPVEDVRSSHDLILSKTGSRNSAEVMAWYLQGKVERDFSPNP